jgi:hypothetical protein
MRTRGTIRELSDEFEIAAQRLNDAGQGTQIHVGASFELRDGRLLNFQFLGQFRLGALARLT